MAAEPRGSGGRRPQGGADGAEDDFPFYLTQWMAYRSLSAADLSRTTGIGESQVSRWLAGATTPDVTSCRRIARAIGRRLLEVLVAAGQITQAEADNTPPAPPLPPPSPAARQLEHIAAAMRDPETPEQTRTRLQVLLEIAEQVAGIDRKRR